MCVCNSHHNVKTCLWHISHANSNISAHWKHGKSESTEKLKKWSVFSENLVEACSRWKRLIMVNSMQANEAPQERMSAAWRLHKRGYEPRRGSVVVKTIDATTIDPLRRSPLFLDQSPHGVNHNMLFPTALKSHYLTFWVLPIIRTRTRQLILKTLQQL